MTMTTVTQRSVNTLLGAFASAQSLMSGKRLVALDRRGPAFRPEEPIAVTLIAHGLGLALLESRRDETGKSLPLTDGERAPHQQLAERAIRLLDPNNRLGDADDAVDDTLDALMPYGRFQHIERGDLIEIAREAISRYEAIQSREPR
jgi:hypothetical protein